MSRYGITRQFSLACIRANSDDEFAAISKNFSNTSKAIVWTNIITHSLPIAIHIYLKTKKYSHIFIIPKRISLIIEKEYLRTIARNKKIEQAMIGLAWEFNKTGIDLIFLKGAAHLATVYKHDRGMRRLRDVDILVRKDDILEAENILRRLGYAEDYERLHREAKGPLLLPRDFWAKEHFHYVYFKDDIQLELHWDIQKVSSELLLKKIFASSHKTTIDGAEIAILNKDADLFVMCADFIRDLRVSSHVFSFAWFRSRDTRTRFSYSCLSFFYKLKNVLQYYGVENPWGDFISLVKLHGKEYEFFSLLILSQKIIAIPLPRTVFVCAKRNVFVSLYMLLSRGMRRDSLVALLILRDLYFAPRCCYKSIVVFVKKRCSFCYYPIRKIVKSIQYRTQRVKPRGTAAREKNL
jgi:hypothetical protein